MNGYIKLHRSLMDNPLWTEKPFSRGQAWVDLLMMANWEDSKIIDGNNVVTVHRGEVARSQMWLADRWGWSRKKVSAFLHLLELEKMGTTKGTAKGTTITIENYSKYQDEGAAKGTALEQLMEQRRNSTGTHINKNKEEKEKQEKREINREMDGTRFKQVDRETLHFKDGDVEIIRGVPQLTEEESNEMLKRCHEQFAPIKARIAAEAMRRIKEREAQQ